MLSFDLETHLIQPGLRAPPIVCGSAEDETGAHLLTRPEAIERFRHAQASGELIIGANIAGFDLPVLAAADSSLLPAIFAALDAGRIGDVQIRQALIDIARGELDAYRSNNSLGALVERHLGLDLSAEKHGQDAWRKRYALLEGTPPERWPWAARVYPLRDVSFAARVYELQAMVDGDAAANLKEEPRTVRAAFALGLASTWGMRTDPAAVAAFRADVEGKHAATLARFTAEGIYRPDGTKNMKRLAELVEAAYLGNPPRSEKTGKPKTDRDTLEESGDELLEALADSGENEKLYSTYLPILEAGTQRPINASTNVLVSTGRTSYYQPNLQNLPRDERVRNCFVPRAGYLFSSTDYSTLELVTLAQTCIWLFGQSVIAESINRDEDLHARFAADMNGVTYETLVAQLAAKDKTAKNARQLAKQANFGFPGGMGPAKLVFLARKAGVRLCEVAGVAVKCGESKTLDRSGKPVCVACLNVAIRLRNDYLQQWPEMRAYFGRMAALTEASGAAVQVLPDGLIRGDCDFCNGCNLHFQGLAARAAKEALYRVSRESYLGRRPDGARSPLEGSRPVVFIHDEIICEHPSDRAAEAAERVSEIMVATLAEHCPDVRGKAPPALMARWYKGAEPVRDASGRLVPWAPMQSQ